MKSVQLLDKHRNHMTICKKIKIDIGPRVNSFFKKTAKLIEGNHKEITSIPRCSVNLTSNLEEHKSKRASSFSQLKDIFSKNNLGSKTTLLLKDNQTDRRFSLKGGTDAACSDEFNMLVQTPVSDQLSYLGDNSLNINCTKSGDILTTTTATTNIPISSNNKNNSNIDLKDALRNTQSLNNSNTKCEIFITKKSKMLSKLKNKIQKSKNFKSLSKDVNYQNINVKGLDSKFGELNKTGYISFHNKEFLRKINTESTTPNSITKDIINKNVIRNDDKLKDCKIVLIRTNNAKMFGKSSISASTSKSSSKSSSSGLSSPTLSDKKVIQIHPLKSQYFMLSKKKPLKKKSFLPSKAKISLPKISSFNPSSGQFTFATTYTDPLNIPTANPILRNILRNTSPSNVTLNNAEADKTYSTLVDSLSSVTSKNTANNVSSSLSISLSTLSTEQVSSRNNFSNVISYTSPHLYDQNGFFNSFEVFHPSENQIQTLVSEKTDDTMKEKMTETSAQEVDLVTTSLQTSNEPTFSNVSGTSKPNGQFKEFHIENIKAILPFENSEECTGLDNEGIQCSILPLSSDHISNSPVLSDTELTHKDSTLTLESETKLSSKILSTNTFSPVPQTTEFELTFESSLLPHMNTNNVPDSSKAISQENYCSIDRSYLEDGVTDSFRVEPSLSFCSSAVTEVFEKINQDMDISMKLDNNFFEEVEQVIHFDDYALEEVVSSFVPLSPPLFSSSSSPKWWQEELSFSEVRFEENESQSFDHNIDRHKEINLLDHAKDASNVKLERSLNCFICYCSLCSLKDYKPHFSLFHFDY